MSTLYTIGEKCQHYTQIVKRLKCQYFTQVLKNVNILHKCLKG